MAETTQNMIKRSQVAMQAKQKLAEAKATA